MVVARGEEVGDASGVGEAAAFVEGNGEGAVAGTDLE